MQNILRHIKLIQAESKKSLTFYEFLEGYSPEQFIEHHQDYFKDNYLEKYFIDEYNLDIDEIGELYDHFGLLDLIQTKYEEFFTQMGPDAAYKWLNPSFSTNWSEYLKQEDFSKEEVAYLIGEADEVNEDFWDKFHELTGEAYSDFGYAEFFGALLSDYELSMQ